MKKSEVYVYIGGKYSAGTNMYLTELNILKAQKLAMKCAEEVINYYCPHMHSRLMDFYVPEVPWDYWMLQSKIVIENLCNCMLTVDNWLNSPGTKMEIALCSTLGHPIFYSFDVFLSWYAGLEDGNLEEIRDIKNYLPVSA